jgi:hypothetical protein
MPEAPANGDLRVSQDPKSNPGYVKVEAFSAGRWHYLITWHWYKYKEFLWYKPDWPDPWALAKVFQRLLQKLHLHLEIKYRHPHNGLQIREASKTVAKPLVEDALAEANQLLADNRPQP